MDPIDEGSYQNIGSDTGNNTGSISTIDTSGSNLGSNNPSLNSVSLRVSMPITSLVYGSSNQSNIVCNNNNAGNNKVVNSKSNSNDHFHQGKGSTLTGVNAAKRVRGSVFQRARSSAEDSFSLFPSFFGGKCLDIFFSILLTIGVLAAIPIISLDFYQRGTAKAHVIVWFSTGIFVILATTVSVFDISQHLNHWFCPGLQKYVVRIMWMVPVYALESWLSLRFIHVAIYFETLREVYEAYVIYNFMQFILAYLGDEDELVMKV